MGLGCLEKRRGGDGGMGGGELGTRLRGGVSRRWSGREGR